MWSLGRVRIVVTVTLILTPGIAWPWGRTGHRVSAAIAQSFLTASAADAVRSLLEPGESLADAAIWAGEQLAVPRSGPWHYVNVPILEQRSSLDPCRGALHDIVTVVAGSTCSY